MTNIKILKDLRERTDVSLAEGKKALVDCNWDLKQAIVILEKKGLIKEVHHPWDKTRFSWIEAYSHHNGQVAVMVEVGCEKRSNKRTEENEKAFRKFCEDLVLHIAFNRPKYLSINDISEDIIQSKRDIYQAQVSDKVHENKIEHVVNSKLAKWLSEVCLVEQKALTVNKITIDQMRSELVRKISENIVIKRFLIWTSEDEDL